MPWAFVVYLHSYCPAQAHALGVGDSLGIYPVLHLHLSLKYWVTLVFYCLCTCACSWLLAWRLFSVDYLTLTLFWKLNLAVPFALSLPLVVIYYPLPASESVALIFPLSLAVAIGIGDTIPGALALRLDIMILCVVNISLIFQKFARLCRKRNRGRCRNVKGKGTVRSILESDNVRKYMNYADARGVYVDQVTCKVILEI